MKGLGGHAPRSGGFWGTAGGSSGTQRSDLGGRPADSAEGVAYFFALHFWTDVEEYFHAALETLREATTLAGPLPVEEKLAEHDLDYRTHFERRMRISKQAVYRAAFRKS